jgi:ABC-type phosphate/phosphonate transport system permease subunit
MTVPVPSGALAEWLRKRGGAVLIFALLFLAWEFAVRLTGIKEYLLPPPSKVWLEFAKRFDPVMASAWVTTNEILAGYALAIVVSIPLAMAIAYSRFMEQAVYPVIVFLQIIPKIAIAPLFIIWFGFGFMPKLLLVFLLSFFPIVVSSIAGFKSADRDVMDFARSTGASMAALLRSACRKRCRRSLRPQGRRGAGGDTAVVAVCRLRQGTRLPPAAIQWQPRHADGVRIIVLLSLIGVIVITRSKSSTARHSWRLAAGDRRDGDVAMVASTRASIPRRGDLYQEEHHEPTAGCRR